MFVWSKLSAARWADAWEERFSGALRTGLALTQLPGGKTVRVEVYCARRAEADRIAREFGGSVRELKNRNWAAAAAESLRPVKIRDRLVIVHDKAARKAVESQFPDRIVLIIPGEMAFGTGDHATTSTCLRLLVDHAAAADGRWSLLDIGCGTGILAIAAVRLGADRADGFDYDPAAVRIAKGNAALNDVSRVSFRRADLLTWSPARRYEVVVANVFHDVLTVSFGTIAGALTPGGTLIVSGILREQLPTCLRAAEAAGFRIIRTVVRGKWATALASTPADGQARPADSRDS